MPFSILFRSSLLLPAWLVLLLLGGAPQAHAMCYNVPTTSAAPIGLCWNTAHPAPGFQDIYRVRQVADRDEFIAVGRGGVILIGSADGQTWTPTNSGTVQDLFAALWDGERYVVVGAGGLVLTSDDGNDWTPRVTNTRQRLLDIAFDGETYVAVGEQGAIVYSDNAEEWDTTTVISPSRRPALHAVMHHDGHFIAVGSSAAVITSTNGSEWIERHYIARTGNAVPATTLRGIAADADKGLVAVGSQGSVLVSDTPDGNWERRTIAGFPRARLFDIAVTAEGSEFIAVGERDAHLEDPEPLLLHSADGIRWSQESGNTLPSPALLRTITIGPDHRIIAGNRILLVGDPEGWPPVEAPPEARTPLQDILSVARGDDPRRHIAVGETGSILVSDDGFDWTAVAVDSGTTHDLHGLSWNRDEDQPRIIAVGSNGTLLHSDNGIDWQDASLTGSQPPDLLAVTHEAGRFVAAGSNGAILTSDDGQVWTPAASPAGAELRAATGDGAGGFIVVGTGGTIITSQDLGQNWSTENSGTSHSLNDIAGGDQGFIAVGNAGGTPAQSTILFSADGRDWEPVTHDVPGVLTLLAVAWNGSQFIAASEGGRFLRSADGHDWSSLGQSIEGRPVRRFHAISADIDGQFLVAGDDGIIAHSGAIDVAIDIDTDDSVSEDDHPGFARAGEDKTYRFLTSNIAILDAPDVEFTYVPPAITAVLPQRLEIVEVVPDEGWSCDPVASDGSLSCRARRLSAADGDPPTLLVTVQVPDLQESAITHQAELDAAGDGNPANNRITVNTRVLGRTAPPLPSPDTDFSSSGTLGALQSWHLALLALLALYFLLPRTISRR